MDGAQVGVFEETDEVSLASLLKSHHGRSLEAKIRLEILSDFTDKTLEGKLADEKLGALLVTPDLAESNSPRAITMRLLDSSGCRSRLASCLGGELLSWGLPPGGLASGLLGTSHFDLS